MRRVAASLNVQPSALYWHVHGKDELFGLMAAQIYREAGDPNGLDAHWRDWLRTFARNLRTALASRRDAALLCAQAKPHDNGQPRSVVRVAAPLPDLGLSTEQALTVKSSTIAYTIGWALYESNPGMQEFLGGLLDIDACFEAGLEALVAGFALSLQP